MPNQHCYASLQLCAIRIALLDPTTGAPDNGADNGYVTTAAQKLDVSVEIEEGVELTSKNGCDALCASFKAADKIKRLTFAMDLCQLDWAQIALMTGSDSFTSGGNIVGGQLPSITGALDRRVSVEAWTKAWDGGEQAVPSYTSPNGAYFHWVFPKTSWLPGTLSMANELMVVPLTGIGEENSRITSNGPFDDWPAAVGNAGGITHVGGWYFDDELPTDACDYIPVISAAS